MSKKLVIIGNGFDIAHGYKTSYKDFILACDHSALSEFKQFSKKYCMAMLEEGAAWYYFEEMVSAITSKWADEELSLYTGEDSPKKITQREELGADIDTLNRVFREIECSLSDYLFLATDRDVALIPSIKKELTVETKVITFNYTDVAEKYTDDIYYIHGSLKENSIVLGYPERSESDLINPAATFFAKIKLRELLNFKRCLMRQGINPSNSEGEKLVQEMERQMQYLYGGKGTYHEIADISVIQKYAQMNHFEPVLLNFGFDIGEISELVIMGHSLQADYDILGKWLQTAENLDTVKLFTFENESEVSIQKKRAFLNKYGYDPILLKY